MIFLEAEPKTLAERRPLYDPLRDGIAVGHSAALAKANERARATGVRQIVTQAFDADVRAANPSLRIFYRIQAVQS